MGRFGIEENKFGEDCEGDEVELMDVSPEPQETLPQDELILVRIIRAEGQASEVEFNMPVRVVVPSDAVMGRHVLASVLAEGAPSQDVLPFEDFFPTLTGLEFVAAFHKHGIWTASDLVDLKRVRRAVTSVSKKIYEAAIRAKNKANGGNKK